MRNLPPKIDLIKSDNWINADYYNRLEILQSIENHISYEEGRQVRTIRPTTMEGENQCGYYSELNPNYIFINEEHLSDRLATSGYNYTAVETVIHEGRHAYQDDVINGKIEHDEMDRDLWEKNFKNEAYISPDDEPFYKYRFQPIEADANDFANAEMDDIHNHLGEDEGYDTYLYNRNYSDMLARDEAILDLGENYEEEIKNEVEERYDMYYGKSCSMECSSDEGNAGTGKEEDINENYDYYNGYCQ